MTDKIVRTTLYILTVSLFVVALSLLALRSFDAALAVFILGFLVMMLVVEPFAGLIFCLLFLYVRPSAYTPGLGGARAFLLMIVATFVMMLTQQLMHTRRIRIIRGSQDYILIWFFVAVVVSHLANLDFELGATATASFARNVLLYFAVTNLVTTRRRLRAFVIALVVGSVLLALMGVYQNLTGVGLTGLGAHRGRTTAIGSAADPNMFALTILVAVPFLFFFLVHRRRAWVRLLSFASIIVIAYVIYSTNSRGGNLSLALVVGVLFIRTKGLKVGIPLTVAAVLAVFLFGPSRMATISVEDAPRIPMWNQGLEFFESHPLFGIGKDAWIQKYEMKYAHNSFIQCAAEMGVFGLISWVLLIYLAMSNAAFVRRENAGASYGELGLYADAAYFGILAFALPAMFLSLTYFWLLYILLALATAITNIHVRESENAYRVLEGRDVVMAVLLSAAGLVVFEVFVNVAMSL